MNFLSKLPLFACGAVLAGMTLSGCGTTGDEPVFTDNPSAPSMAGLSSSSSQSGSERAVFNAGETVIVATSTGSDSETGPIAASGQNYLIADDGTITLPLIGTVQAAGKSPAELQEEITKRYVPQYYINLTVTVTAQYRVFYVGGEVGHPGPEVYNGQTTVTTAIQAAGDLTQFASHMIWLTRADGTRIHVNYNQALKDSSKDLQVFPGDKIHVPRRYF